MYGIIKFDIVIQRAPQKLSIIFAVVIPPLSVVALQPFYVRRNYNIKYQILV